MDKVLIRFTLLFQLLFGAVVLIQTPEGETQTVYVEEVDESVYFVITEDGSETVYAEEVD